MHNSEDCHGIQIAGNVSCDGDSSSNCAPSASSASGNMCLRCGSNVCDLELGGHGDSDSVDVWPCPFGLVVVEKVEQQGCAPCHRWRHAAVRVCVEGEFCCGFLFFC